MTALIVCLTGGFYLGGIVSLVSIMGEARNEQGEPLPFWVQVKFAALWPLALWRRGV